MGKALSGELSCPCDRSCFSGGVDGSVNFCRAFALALFCDRALTGETPYSTEFICMFGT